MKLSRRPEMSQLSNEELLGKLRDCFIRWAECLEEMAAIVLEAESRGIEVTVENSFLPIVRLIAHGQVSAELVRTCIGDPPLLNRAMRLPMPEQERIAANEPLRVMDLNGDHRLVRPLDMSASPLLLRQVFYGKRLRTDPEQVTWLRENREKESAKHAVVQDRPITLDRRRKGIVVNGLFIPLDELAGFVASLSRA